VSLADPDDAPVAPAGALGGVPVIDIAEPSPETVAQIGAACRDWGFFQVVAHGVPEQQIAGLLRTTRAYFDQPREAKRKQLRSMSNPWGYYDRELTKEQRDRKEIFDIGPDAGDQRHASGPFEGATPWPGDPMEFEAVMRSWFRTMHDLAQRLLGWIGESLGAENDALLRSVAPEHTSFLRLNFYPVADPLAGEAADEAQLGIHHHTDAGALTVLLQDGVSGLQVFHDGQWHGVDPVPGAFTINIGDMVQVWSNDLYPAALHRVLAMTSEDRLSIPYFLNPAYGADVAPLVGAPRYRPINWGEFRRRRAEGDFAAYGTEVQIGEWRIA
jgi:isopenicillin N synthase-like dioxygenase